MYVGRGFGYGGSQSATEGRVVVPMTTLGANPTTSQQTTAINQFTPFLLPSPHCGASHHSQNLFKQLTKFNLQSKTLRHTDF
jgi:type IV pilus assembly protein PilY1